MKEARRQRRVRRAEDTMLRMLLLCAALLLAPLPCMAAEAEGGNATPGKSLWGRFSRRVSQTWNSPAVDLYVPVYTWHNRLMYDTERTEKYNENPWGAGIGKSFEDEDGDWHALYYMGFQASHDMYQPIVGYAYQKNWRPAQTDDFRLGLGFTLGITARQQYNYIPLPLPLPIFGVEYKRLALQATYIPGGYNNGNVLFCWLRWRLN